MSRSAEHRRRSATVLVATSVVAAGFGLWPATAGADPDPLGIGVARTLSTEHGSFRVPVWTDAAGGTVTSVTATIRDGASTVTTLDLVDGGDGFWAPAAPLELTDDGGVMPHLGHYAIDVTAGDDQSDTATRDDAGTLDFTLRPEFATTGGITLTFDPAVLDLSHPTGTASGTLLGVRPGSGVTVPLAGYAVTVERSDEVATPTRTTVTTGDDGSFAAGQFVEAGLAYSATFAAADEYVDGSASTGSTWPTVHQETGYLTASANLKRAVPGQKVTISGFVRTGPGSGSPGLVGAPVQIDLNGNSVVTTTTDASGKFAGVVTATAGSYGTWSVTFAGPYVQGDAVSGSIALPSEASYVGARITLASDGAVHASGRLIETYHPEDAVYTEVTRLEYSKDGKTGWKVLRSGTNPYGDGSFSISAWGYVSGYYRLYHPTSDNLATTATKPVHLSRIVTRIYRNDAAPEPVKKGATVTVTGTLQEQRGTWRAMGSRVIGLFFLATGAKTWTLYAHGRTDAHGHAKLSAKASRTGRWLLQYFGDSTHFDSYGTSDVVTVH